MQVIYMSFASHLLVIQLIQIVCQSCAIHLSMCKCWASHKESCPCPLQVICKSSASVARQLLTSSGKNPWLAIYHSYAIGLSITVQVCASHTQLQVIYKSSASHLYVICKPYAGSASHTHVICMSFASHIQKCKPSLPNDHASFHLCKALGYERLFSHVFEKYLVL